MPIASPNPQQQTKRTWLVARPVRWLSALLLSNLVFLCYAGYRFWHVQLLPPPFFYNPHDTFMDFFNTNFWAFDQDRYESWKSIYPLFTFLIGRLLGSARCASTTGFEMRDCEFNTVWPLFGVYVVGIGLSALLYVKALKRIEMSQTKLFALTFAAFLLSLPGLFALERGNYIIIAFGFLALSAYWQNDWRGAVAPCTGCEPEAILDRLLAHRIAEKTVPLGCHQRQRRARDQLACRPASAECSLRTAG